MAKDERQKARADVRRAQVKLEGAQSKKSRRRVRARRGRGERARKAELTLARSARPPSCIGPASGTCSARIAVCQFPRYKLLPLRCPSLSGPGTAG